jgi:hypothetical protein
VVGARDVETCLTVFLGERVDQRYGAGRVVHICFHRIMALVEALTTKIDLDGVRRLESDAAVLEYQRH